MLANPGGDAHIESMATEAPGALRPAVVRLALTEFRGYAAARLAVAPAPVVLTGPNGAGKTNLLEAISFLAPGRGLRRARLSEIDRRPNGAADAPGVAPWTLWAEVLSRDGTVEIGTGRDAGSDGGERRHLRIDGSPARSQAALSEHLSLVWLTPQMDRLFLDGGTQRRRFLDRLVYGFDALHAARVSAYERAMRERQRLLRDGPADPSWLAALEEGMAENGIAVAAARRQVTAELDAACAESSGAFPRARLALQGAVDDWLAAMPALAAEEEFRRRLLASRRADAEAGATVGPHRSDLVVRHVASGRLAAQCSTGEQKALLIAIVLAHARRQKALRGAPPVLLLDEVAAHLDRGRREALYAEIAALGAQAWLTGTDPALFDGMRGLGQFLAVADASIRGEE
jgi:DNA replication and repair protein RecF